MNTRTPSRAVAELSALTRLGVPLIGTQLFIMATGFIDTVMAGRFSAVDLAGVTLGGSILWPIFMLLTGITMALTPIVSQLRGADQVVEAGLRVRQGLWFALFASALSILVFQNTAVLFELAEIDQEASRIGTDYLSAVCWGLPPIYIYVALRQTSEGLGHTIPPMVIAGSVLPLNGLLNYAFIYGEFGLPQLGGVGCGWATAIVFWLELGLMLIVTRMPFFRRTGVLGRFEGPNLREIGRLLLVGAPIGITIFIEMAVFSIITLLVGRIGVVEVASHSIAGNINWMTYVIPMSIGTAAGIRVGYAVGAGRFDDAKYTAKVALLFALGYALLVSVLLVIGRHPLVSLYSTDGAVLGVAAELLLFIAVYQLVDDTQATAGGILRGYKDTRVPMLYGLVGYWVIAMPIGTTLAFGLFGLPAWGVHGFWAAMTFGLALVAVAMVQRVRRTASNNERIRKLALT